MEAKEKWKNIKKNETKLSVLVSPRKMVQAIMMKSRFNSDDICHLKKELKMHCAVILVRSAIYDSNIYCPQLSLD